MTALLLLACAIVIAERNYDADGTNYLARFTYDDSWMMVPLTNPPGQPHYYAKFDLFRVLDVGQLLVAKDVSGTYTEKGCFEDSLSALFYAVAQQKSNPQVSVEAVGKNIHFADTVTVGVATFTNANFYVTNTEAYYGFYTNKVAELLAGGGPIITNANPTMFAAPETTVLTNYFVCSKTFAPPGVTPPMTNGAPFVTTVSAICDWLLVSEWLEDPSTNYDLATHYDTNRFTSNLVVRVFYPPKNETITNVLESIEMTNILRAWHWSPPTKIYD